MKYLPCADGYPGGEKLRWSIIFPPWQVKASTLPCHEYTNNLSLLRGVENWAGQFFRHADLWKYQSYAGGYLGGGKLGWSIIFPPWQVKASTLPCHEYANNLCFKGVGKNWAGPFFPHPD